MTSVLL